MTHARSVRAVPAAMAAILSVIATYAILRAHDVLFTADLNPALVLWSEKIAMFWRLSGGSYVGGMVAIIVFFMTARNFHATLKAVAWAVPITAVMITIQGLFLP